MTSFPFLIGRRAGTPIQPDDAESAGLQREPWASPHVSGPPYGAVPAPPSSDRLHHGYHGSAYAASVWLPACHWTPPSSTSTTASIPACHAGPTAPTRLHAASSTSTGTQLHWLWGKRWRRLDRIVPLRRRFCLHPLYWTIKIYLVVVI